MDGNKLGYITSSEETRESTQDDSTTAFGAQDVDDLVKIPGWYRFLASDVTEMRSKGGVQLENLLRNRKRPTVFEDGSVTLDPKLMENNSTKHLPNHSKASASKPREALMGMVAG